VGELQEETQPYTASYQESCGEAKNKMIPTQAKCIIPLGDSTASFSKPSTSKSKEHILGDDSKYDQI
jgi:hypothetical protein